MRHLLPFVCSLCLYFYAVDTSAEEAKPNFPKVLTLSDALAMVAEDHPAFLKTRSDTASVRADQLDLKNRGRPRTHLELDLRTVDRIAFPGHRFTDDSRALLTLDKPLHFFGKLEPLSRSIATRINALQQTRAGDRTALRLNIIQAFFDVILSDYAYAAIDEEMTLAFLNFDSTRDRWEIYHEVAEVEVRKLESLYLDALARRTEARHAQRASRLRLALTLNRPQAYPDRLIEPDLSAYRRDNPDYEELLARVLQNNPVLQAKQLDLQALKHRLTYLTDSRRPVLGTKFQAADYEDTSSARRDRFRVSLYLNIPLSASRDSGREVARQQAEILKKESEVALLEQELRLQTLRLIQQLEQLDAEITSARSHLLYTELELDKVRLQYEMEVHARIGSANAEVAKAVYELAAARYRKALVWEKIDALSATAPVTFD